MNHGLYARNSSGQKIYLPHCISLAECAERRNEDKPQKTRGTRCPGCGGKYIGTFCRLCHVNATTKHKERR